MFKCFQDYLRLNDVVQHAILYMSQSGVTKVVTVDIRGSWQRWLKVRDLTKDVTYCFRIQAKTIAYGPEAEANITAGPVKGELYIHEQTTKHQPNSPDIHIRHSSTKEVGNLH